jgi:NADPH:quinone reductase-like Zn-dependent oxidoreductase/acyl carrier protein
VAVRASGLNFRDVLNALGTYPGPPGPLGDECAGTVTAVGPGVADIAPGDDVLAVASGSLATHVIARAHLVARRPARLTFAEAAACPIVFLTAEYALARCARLARGERVLIHAAAGGVGLAAVQVAQRAGAEIFATAGGERKREYLRRLGIAHVFDSRSLDFADQIRAAAGDRPIDAVLNSLAGEFIPRSLELLAPAGRFIEIGRTGVWTPQQVADLRPDVAYTIVFMGDLFDHEPEPSRALLRDVLEALEQGVYRLPPVRTFALARAADAFRFMAQARHIGKLAIVPGREAARSEARPVVRGDRSYLVTGGLGALGLHAARELVSAGARHLVLAGRSAPGAAAAEAIGDLRASGARVEVLAADVSTRADAVRLVEAATRLAPIGGVIHAAGVVRDASLLQQDEARLLEVMAAKVAGAWHLHDLTLGQPLDLFVLFSSAAAVLGSAGQANYTAANAVLDALAAYRQAQGLPAVAIDWGPWADGGMATALGAREQARLVAQGWQPFSPDEGRRAFRSLLTSRSAQVATMNVDWSRYLRQVPAAPALLAGIGSRPERTAEAAPEPTVVALRDALVALPVPARREALVTHVTGRVATVLGLTAAHRFDADMGLRDAGLDSLMALELRNLLQADAGRALPATLAFDYPTIEAIAAFLADAIGLTTAAPETDADRPASDLDAIHAMSDREAEALLGAELDALDGSGRKG